MEVVPDRPCVISTVSAMHALMTVSEIAVSVSGVQDTAKCCKIQ